MAKADFKLPEDFLDKLAQIERDEARIADRVLNAGAEVVVEKVRQNLIGTVGRDTAYPSRATGELVSALGVTTVRVNRNGDYDIKIGFAEPRRDGDSNAKIANVLEYGKHGQPPKPFLKPAKTASKSACMDAMKRALEDELKQ